MTKKAALILTSTGAAVITSASLGVNFLNNKKTSQEDETKNETDALNEVKDIIEKSAAAAGTISDSIFVTDDNEIKKEPSIDTSWLNSSQVKNNSNKYFGQGGTFSNATFQTMKAETTKVSFPKYKSFHDGSYQNGDYAKIKSNLIITVNRKQWGDSYNYDKGKKWSGTLTWFWAFLNEKTNKGFITFNQAKTDAKKGGLVLTGYFYIVEKIYNADNSWNVKYKKEITEKDNKVLNKENFYQYFPKPYWYTQWGKFDQLYYTNWDFINDVQELNGTMATMCDENSDDSSYKCPNNPTKIIKQEGEWEWVSGPWWEENYNGWTIFTTKWFNKPYEWAGDYQSNGGVQWFNYMYGKEFFNLRPELWFFDVGTWKVKEDKWFRREGGEQKLRGDKWNGWA